MFLSKRSMLFKADKLSPTKGIKDMVLCRRPVLYESTII